MMDRTILQDLRARVRTATEPDRELDARIWAEFEGRDVRRVNMIGRPALLGRNRRAPHDVCVIRSPIACHVNVPAFTRSIDAAVALVGRMLPGWTYRIEHTAERPAVHCQLGTCGGVFGETVPLAILAALLDALIEQHPA